MIGINSRSGITVKYKGYSRLVSQFTNYRYGTVTCHSDGYFHGHVPFLVNIFPRQHSLCKVSVQQCSCVADKQIHADPLTNAFLSRLQCHGLAIGLLDVASACNIAPRFPSAVLGLVSMSSIFRHMLPPAAILTERRCIRYLRLFAARCRQEDALFFWLDIEKYRRAKGDAKLRKLSREIWDAYLKPNAELKFEASSGAVATVRERVGRGDVDRFLFNDLQEEVQSHVTSALVPSFWDSQEYQEMLKALVKELAGKASMDVSGEVFVSMNDLLENPLGVHIFRKFLKTMRLEHALDFHLSAVAYRTRTLSEEERARDANFIYKRFIYPKSKACAIQSPEIQQSVAAKMREGLRVDVFDSAWNFVQEGMRTQVYPLFARSVEFRRAAKAIIDLEEEEHRFRAQKLHQRTASEAAKFWQVLRAGENFVKYRSHSEPLWRCVSVDGKLMRLRWYDPDGRDSPSSSAAAAAGSSMDVAEITEILRGKQTQTFVDAAPHLSPDVCFSVVSPQTTLDLRAKDKATRELWLAALTWLVTRSPDVDDDPHCYRDPDIDIWDPDIDIWDPHIDIDRNVNSTETATYLEPTEGLSSGGQYDYTTSREWLPDEGQSPVRAAAAAGAAFDDHEKARGHGLDDHEKAHGHGLDDHEKAYGHGLDDREEGSADEAADSTVTMADADGPTPSRPAPLRSKSYSVSTRSDVDDLNVSHNALAHSDRRLLGPRDRVGADATTSGARVARPTFPAQRRPQSMPPTPTHQPGAARSGVHVRASHTDASRPSTSAVSSSGPSVAVAPSSVSALGAFLSLSPASTTTALSPASTTTVPAYMLQYPTSPSDSSAQTFHRAHTRDRQSVNALPSPVRVGDVDALVSPASTTPSLAHRTPTRKLDRAVSLQLATPSAVVSVSPKPVTSPASPYTVTPIQPPLHARVHSALTSATNRYENVHMSQVNQRMHRTPLQSTHTRSATEEVTRTPSPRALITSPPPQPPPPSSSSSSPSSTPLIHNALRPLATSKQPPSPRAASDERQSSQRPRDMRDHSGIRTYTPPPPPAL